jgi:hypothetical protein
MGRSFLGLDTNRPALKNRPIIFILWDKSKFKGMKGQKGKGKREKGKGKWKMENGKWNPDYSLWFLGLLF